MSISTNQNKNVEKKEISDKKRKNFKHTPNIILKRGTYKGYLGYVKRYNPEMLEIELMESDYISQDEYGKRKIGEVLLTKYGPSQIIKDIPQLYVLNTQSTEAKGVAKEGDVFDIIKAKKVVFEKTKVIPKNTLKFVVYTDKSGKYNFGELIEKSSEKCRLRPIQLEIPQGLNNIPDMLQYLSSEIKANKALKKSDEISCDIKMLDQFEYYIIINDDSETRKNLGKFGTLNNMDTNMYSVRYKKIFRLNKSDTKSDKNVLKITKGPYKNRIIKLLRVIPSTLHVYINALSKTVISHLVKTNNLYLNRSIFPEDVFYMDLELNNGNFFEVKKIQGNIISGTEKVGNKYITKTISQDEIKNKSPGFSFDDVEKESEGIQEERIVAEEGEGEEVTVEEEDEEEQRQDYGEEEETTEPKMIEEDMYKSSFKDLERTFATTTVLTSKQQDILKTIKKILNIFNINEDDADIRAYEIVSDAEMSIKKMQQLLLDMQIETWAKSDEKYVIASLVLFKIIKKGYRLQTKSNDTLTNYVRNLIDKKIFSKKDVGVSIFLNSKMNQYYIIDKNVISNLKKSGEYNSLHKLMMSNCLELLSKWYEKINIEDIKYSEPLAIFPIQKKQNQQLSLTTKDMISLENPWDLMKFFPNAKSIIWAPKFTKYIEEYKLINIDPKIKDKSKNQETKIVFKYVYDNLHRAPFAKMELLELIKRNKKQIDLLKKETLELVFNDLIVELRNLYKQISEEKEKVVSQIQSEKMSIIKKRKEIMKTGKRKADDEESEDMDETSSKISKLSISDKASEKKQDTLSQLFGSDSDSESDSE